MIPPTPTLKKCNRPILSGAYRGLALSLSGSGCSGLLALSGSHAFGWLAMADGGVSRHTRLVWENREKSMLIFIK